MPGPSSPETHPIFPGIPRAIPAPAFTQLMSSFGTVNMVPVEMVVGVSWRLFTLTKILNPLNPGIPETLIQKLTRAPWATTGWLAGATKTMGDETP
jgi:hypothetical protein